MRGYSTDSTAEDLNSNTYSTYTQVFESIQPLCVSVLDGYNVCIFAYGQTGSGKVRKSTLNVTSLPHLCSPSLTGHFNLSSLSILLVPHFIPPFPNLFTSSLSPSFHFDSFHVSYHSFSSLNMCVLPHLCIDHQAHSLHPPISILR